jgi:hypothetical protein
LTSSDSGIRSSFVQAPAEQVGVALDMLELRDALLAELRVDLDEGANGAEHRVHQAAARSPVRVDGRAQHLGGLIVAVHA